MASASAGALLRQVWPLLLVRDLDQARQFYVDRLGFRVVDEAASAGRVFWLRLERDGVSLMLQQAEAEDGDVAGRTGGLSLFLLCDNVDALHNELATQGLPLDAPQDAYYGMRQLFVTDPDGYQLCFETPQPTG